MLPNVPYVRRLGDGGLGDIREIGGEVFLLYC